MSYSLPSTMKLKLVFTNKVSQTFVPTDRTQRREKLPAVKATRSQGYLEQFSAHTSPLDQMGYITACRVNQLMSVGRHPLLSSKSHGDQVRSPMPGERHHRHQNRPAGQPYFSLWENHAVSPLKTICGHTEEKNHWQQSA